MSSIICRIAGIVSFSDGSNEPFEATLDAKGLVAVVNATASEDAVAQDAANDDKLSTMLALLADNVPDLDGVLNQDSKTVNDFVAQITGRIARDDQTTGDFIAQYNSRYGAFVPSGGDISVWKEMTDDSTTKDLIDTMFKAINGGSSAF